MSKYTTEVRYICEHYAGLTESAGFDDIDDVLDDSWDKIFKEFPIFDENYRKPLCTKILSHYYTREIGEETVGLWKLRLNNRMNEIMPYYNKLYESELLKFNPLYDVDLTRNHIRSEDSNRDYSEDSSKDIDGNKTTNTDAERTTNATTDQNTLRSTDSDSKTHDKIDEVHWTLYNDTPQGGINGIEGLEQGTYLTNATKNTADDTRDSKTENSTIDAGSSNEKSTAKDTSESSANEITSGREKNNRNGNDAINTTEDYLEHVQGKQGLKSYSNLLLEYRKTFINIDMMVIEELKDLFFLLWE